MSHSDRMIAFARELAGIPAGMAAHPGLTGAQTALVASRLAGLAGPLDGLLPDGAERLRLAAGLLQTGYARTGVSGPEVAELATWLAMMAGLVAMHERPQAAAAGDGRAA